MFFDCGELGSWQSTRAQNYQERVQLPSLTCSKYPALLLRHPNRILLFFLIVWAYRSLLYAYEICSVKGFSKSFHKISFSQTVKKMLFHLFMRRKLVQDVHKDSICPCQLNIFVFSLSLMLLVERICFNIKTSSPLLVNSFILITCMLD